ncbi:hypothetical protein [Parafrankia discariae]|uniref:hypothetical protein n=1 Tax=Parafrankia discariae TaxID=365528 RepID=UPI00055742C2|nr:hypothetical protein [Parafrankia discariae]
MSLVSGEYWQEPADDLFSRTVHECTRNAPVAVLTVAGDQVEVRPQGTARPLVLRALAGRLTGPVWALPRVLVGLARAGVVVVLPVGGR